MDTKSGVYHSPGRGSKRIVVQKLLVCGEETHTTAEVSLEGLAMIKRRKEEDKEEEGRGSKRR